MRIRPVATSAAASTALALMAWMVPKALALQYDVVHVNLPYAVMIGAKILPPGDCTIEQLRSPDSTELLFYSPDGKTLEASAMTTRALYGNTDDNPPTTSSVILQRIGEDYYFNKMFVTGKGYGYELPLPAGARRMEKESRAQTITIPATTSTLGAD